MSALGVRRNSWTIRNEFMYSYEDRIHAVELYIHFGKRLTATVRQLG